MTSVGALALYDSICAAQFGDVIASLPFEGLTGLRVPFDGEKNVLSVIRKAGIEMPNFCYYSDLSVYGACHMCVVEDEKTGKIDASCSMEPRDGMRINTNSAWLMKK